MWLDSELTKKLLLFALPYLPTATGAAYTIPNIRRGFMYNRQLDGETTRAPILPQFGQYIKRKCYCGLLT